MALILSGVGCILLAVLAVFFLIRSHRQYRLVNRDLKETGAQLDQLRSGNPRHGNRFPSGANVEITERNRVSLQTAFQELYKGFSVASVAGDPVEPARFPLLLDQTLRELNEQALVNSVEVTEQFHYGFDQYASALPQKEDILRLTRQLAYVKIACRALFDQRINALKAVQRQPFDAAEKAGSDGTGIRRTAPGTPGIEQIPPGEFKDATGLYFRERIIITFRSRERNIWDTLNALVKLSPFCIISLLEIDNRTEVVDQSSAASGAVGTENLLTPSENLLTPVVDPAPKAKPVRILPHEERIVAGRSDVVDVKIGLDFIRFEGLGSDEQKRSSP